MYFTHFFTWYLFLKSVISTHALPSVLGGLGKQKMASALALLTNAFGADRLHRCSLV
mgnify:FL=1